MGLGMWLSGRVLVYQAQSLASTTEKRNSFLMREKLKKEKNHLKGLGVWVLHMNKSYTGKDKLCVFSSRFALHPFEVSSSVCSFKTGTVSPHLHQGWVPRHKDN